MKEKPARLKEDALAKIFNPDQVNLLRRGLKRARKWSNKTISDSFEYRFACGSKGYNFLRDERDFPIPCIRSQQDYLKNLHFDTGVLSEVFTLMQAKVNCMSPIEKDCGLIVDEMSGPKHILVTLLFLNKKGKLLMHLYLCWWAYLAVGSK